jgi:hypothetical protein
MVVVSFNRDPIEVGRVGDQVFRPDVEDPLLGRQQSHRNALSGVVESTASSTSVEVPAFFWISRKLLDNIALSMESPRASQTGLRGHRALLA